MNENKRGRCLTTMMAHRIEVFCAGMKHVLKVLNYDSLLAACNSTNFEMRIKGPEDEDRRAIAFDLSSSYKSLEPQFNHEIKFFDTVMFFLSTSSCNAKHGINGMWSDEENAHLFRAVFQYGTDFEQIKLIVFPNREIDQIKRRWWRVFNTYIYEHLPKDEAEEENEEESCKPTINMDEFLKNQANSNNKDFDDIRFSFDPEIFVDIQGMELRMIEGVAEKLAKSDISPYDLIVTIFYLIHEKPMERYQLIAFISKFNEFRQSAGNIGSLVDQKTILTVFLRYKIFDSTWVALQECIEQNLISDELINDFFKEHNITPISGFRLKTPQKRTRDEILKAARMTLKNKKKKNDAKHATMQAAVQTSKNTDLVIKSEENRYIELFRAANQHKKGVEYTQDEKYFFKALYIISPTVIRFLNECGVAPDSSTVYRWINEEQDVIIHEIEDESKILDVIHTVTDEYTKTKDGPIIANIAGDGIYLEEKNEKKLQYYAFQLQPLDKDIPCVCINIKSIGAKNENVEMHSEDIPKKLAEFAELISNDDGNKFTVNFISTDSDHSTDSMHTNFFKKHILPKGSKFDIEEAARQWTFKEVIPITDFLHAMKLGRSHVLNHNMKLHASRSVINISRIKEVLNIGNALSDTSHWAKMSDAFAIALFQFTSFFEILKKIGGDEACYMAPFTFLNEAIRSPLLSIKSRIKLIQSAYLMFWWNYTNIINNCSDAWKEKFQSGITGTLFGTRVFVIRCMNLCFGLAVGLIHVKDCPLDRIGTHVLENFFGFIRVASKNFHTPKMMLTHTARSVIFRQCTDSLGIHFKHKGRENSGGVKVNEAMEAFTIMENINPEEITCSFTNNTVCTDDNIMTIFTKYYESIKEKGSGYPHIYYPFEFSAKQPSNRIKGRKDEKLTPVRMGTYPFTFVCYPSLGFENEYPTNSSNTSTESTLVPQNQHHQSTFYSPQIQPFWATPTQASRSRTPYTPQRPGMSQSQPSWSTPTQASRSRTPYTPQRPGMSQSQSSRISIPPSDGVHATIEQNRLRMLQSQPFW